MQTLYALLMILVFATGAQAGTISYTDPAGDDFGPGKYKYPIDAVYKRGSFDLRGVEIRDRGTTVEFRVSLNQRIEDPWDSRSWQPKGNGFSVQLIQIYLDIDHKPGSGFTRTLPGVNARFAPADAGDGDCDPPRSPRANRTAWRSMSPALRGDRRIVARNTQHHGASGLIDRVRSSSVTLQAAEAAALDFVRGLCNERHAQPAGACIFKDVQFLEAHLPRFARHLHHRTVDVSSVRELGRYAQNLGPERAFKLSPSDTFR